MEKISSIIPRSKRVSSSDVMSGPAVRPGAPSFGRPAGSSTAGVQDVLTTAQRASAEHQRVMDKRAISGDTPQLVEELANRFFMQRMASAPVSEVAIEAPVGELELPPPPEMASGEFEYTPPGTYLNLEV